MVLITLDVQSSARHRKCVKPHCFLIFRELDSEFSKTVGKGVCPFAENGVVKNVTNFEELMLGTHRCFRDNGEAFTIEKLCTFIFCSNHEAISIRYKNSVSQNNELHKVKL